MTMPVTRLGVFLQTTPWLPHGDAKKRFGNRLPTCSSVAAGCSGAFPHNTHALRSSLLLLCSARAVAHAAAGAAGRTEAAGGGEKFVERSVLAQSDLRASDMWAQHRRLGAGGGGSFCF